MNIFKRPLTFRLIVYLFILSIVFISILTVIEYDLSLKTGLREIEESYTLFEESSLESIVVSLYYVDYNLLDIQLSGLLKLSHIEYVELIEKSGDSTEKITTGKLNEDQYDIQSFDLIHYDTLGKEYYLGDISLYANISRVRDSVVKKTIDNMIPKLFLVFVISITLFFMFQFIIIRHFNTIIKYTENLDYSEKGTDLKLDRLERTYMKNDELSQVVDSINSMRHKIYSDFKTISEIEDELQELNNALQYKVDKQSSELEDAIDALRTTQNKLVESEKLSALRGLIAGITHEINNPVGISVTGVSFLSELSKDIDKKFKKNSMKKSDLESYLSQVLEISLSVSNNLQRAADLIGSLKKLSTDQATGETRKFNVGEYIDEILITLRVKLKRTKHRIDVNCAKNIIIDSSPGAFGQILTNLVLNSLLHGFEGIDSGTITIDISQIKEGIKFIYRDNGVGVKDDIKDKIFDQFFTTKKDKGGSGLGLQIINSIVCDTLGGSLDFNSSEGKGVEFIMTIPQ